LLEPWIDELIPEVDGALRDVLVQLKQRPTFAEQWPDQYQSALAQGRARMLKLEQIRTQKITMTDILSARPTQHPRDSLLQMPFQPSWNRRQ
jgi:hypothetical protein